ncbi:MAG: conjugal transfer protein TraG N-terminal domain-containing protein [Nitrospirota bacterium]
MTWLIYTFGNGNMLFDVFTSIALMVGAGYESLIRLAMMGLLIGGLAYVIGRGHVPWQLLCGAMLLFAVTVQIRANVTIQDLVNPGVPTRTVGNIPLAVAFPAYVASEMSFQLLTLAETAFALTVPPEYQVINASFGKGFFDFQKLLGVQLPDGDLQRNLTEYIKSCVIPEIARGGLTTTAVFHAQDMLAAISVIGALETMPVYVGGALVPAVGCTTAYTTYIAPAMAPGGDAGYDLAMKQLRQAFGVPDVALNEELPVTTAMTRLLGTGQAARAAINNVLIHERWRDVQYKILQQGNDTAGAIALLGNQLSEDLKNQALADSMMNARFLPMLRTLSESAVYLLTPFALVMAFTPSMFATIRSTVTAYAWLLLWAPLYAIVNYLVYAYGTVQLTSLVDPGVGLTYANYSDFNDVLAQLNSFASKIAWGVPSMAAVLSYGLGSAVSSLSQGGQGFQAAASQEGSALAHGTFKATDPGRHLEYQDVMSFDAAGHEHHEQVLRSTSGMMTTNQTGTRELSFADGAHTTIGTTGTITHTDQHGYYSQDKDGHYLSGVWRQDVHDETSGQTMSMQREVLGSEIRSRGAYEDQNGVQHHVEQMENQYDHSQMYREESWSANGVQHSRMTQGDGSEIWKTDGSVFTAPVSPDGHVMGAPRAFREQNTFFKAAPTDSNPYPGWEHQFGELSGGQDGQEHYATHIDTSGESPESHNYVRNVTGGSSNHNVSDQGSYHGMSVSSQLGSDAHVGSVSGASPVAFTDKNGHRHVSDSAVISAAGVELDAEGHPVNGFSGHAVTNDGGKQGIHEGKLSWNKEDQMWEMAETDSQYHSRLDTHKSGSRMFLPSAGLTLESGDYVERGSDGQGGFSYSGLVSDQHGHQFRAHVEGKDGKIAYSDMAEGSTQQVVQDDGHRLTLTGNPGGNDFTYQEEWTGQAFQDNGKGQLASIGQTHFTSRGHAHLDSSRGSTFAEQLVRTPDTTVAENKSAFGERSLAVSASRHPMSELQIGQVSGHLDGAAASGEAEPLYGGEGFGYVISAGAGTEKFNSIDTTQNVQRKDGTRETQHLEKDGQNRVVSGSTNSTLNSRSADKDGNFVTRNLAKGGDAGGEWQVLTQHRSNENSFSGTFDVPSLTGKGSSRVSGAIDMAPDGSIVSMNWTNLSTGKQMGYHSGANGPVFTVGDVSADPNNPEKGRLTNVREVSHREAESEGGFHIQDVINQAGNVIWSDGDKGTARRENNSYVLDTRVTENSTMVAKGQQSLEALGMAEHFNPDQPGPWKEAAVTAEGLRLGWSTAMEATRATRFRQSADKITGGGGASPYNPNAPTDPSLKPMFDGAQEEVDAFMKRKGIPPSSGRRGGRR